MALSTTLWTWLHFAFVLAPLAAGAITKYALEKPAERRLDQARQRDEFVVAVGVLVTLRFILFYLCWAGIALLPVWLLIKYPEVLETILWLGWRLAGTTI